MITRSQSHVTNDCSPPVCDKIGKLHKELLQLASLAPAPQPAAEPMAALCQSVLQALSGQQLFISLPLGSSSANTAAAASSSPQQEQNNALVDKVGQTPTD